MAETGYGRRPLQLNAIEAGEGPPLLILHGLLGSARNWAGIVRDLGDCRHAVAVDLPNHGASPWSEAMDYPFLAARAAEQIERLGPPAAVIGHSMGGKVAMTLALTRPELVERLLVVDVAPVAYGHSFAPYIRAMRAVPLAAATRRADVDAVLARQIADPGVRAFLLQNLEGSAGSFRWRANLAALNAAMEEILGFPEFDGRLYDGPTLFLAGAASDYVSPNYEGEIRRLFPQSRIERLAGAGHWVHADKPQEFLAAVRRFLAE